eukprot:scaffold107507_cov69-Phaeocystis_antarctica.AAC.4
MVARAPTAPSQTMKGEWRMDMIAAIKKVLSPSSVPRITPIEATKASPNPATPEDAAAAPAATTASPAKAIGSSITSSMLKDEHSRARRRTLAEHLRNCARSKRGLPRPPLPFIPGKGGPRASSATARWSSQEKYHVPHVPLYHPPSRQPSALVCSSKKMARRESRKYSSTIESSLYVVGMRKVPQCTPNSSCAKRSV